MNILCELNPENATEEEVGSWYVREAARAVVLDSEGKIALLHVAHKNYYKLPGGGFEGGEDPAQALVRECREEIGCRVEVVAELGTVIELRKLFTTKQVSYCYVAKVVGEKGDTNFTDEERTHGFMPVWLSPEEALRTLKGSRATDQEGEEYIVPRDTAIFEAARQAGFV